MDATVLRAAVIFIYDKDTLRKKNAVQKNDKLETKPGIRGNRTKRFANGSVGAVNDAEQDHITDKFVNGFVRDLFIMYGKSATFVKKSVNVVVLFSTVVKTIDESTNNAFCISDQVTYGVRVTPIFDRGMEKFAIVLYFDEGEIRHIVEQGGPCGRYEVATIDDVFTIIDAIREELPAYLASPAGAKYFKEMSEEAHRASFRAARRGGRGNANARAF